MILIQKQTKMRNRHVVQAGKVQSSTVPNNKIRKYYFCFLTVDNFSNTKEL